MSLWVQTVPFVAFDKNLNSHPAGSDEMSEPEDFDTFMANKEARVRFAKGTSNVNLRVHRDPQCNTEYLPCPAALSDIAKATGYKAGRKDPSPAHQLDSHGNNRWPSFWRRFQASRWADIATHPAVRGTLNERHATHTQPPSLCRTNRTPSTRTYPHGTFVPKWYNRTTRVCPYRRGTAVLRRYDSSCLTCTVLIMQR